MADAQRKNKRFQICNKRLQRATGATQNRTCPDMTIDMREHAEVTCCAFFTCCYLESGATIRLAISGKEIVINGKELVRIQTMRNFHQHIRNLLEIEMHISLNLRFVGSRVYGRIIEEHEVRCDDSECTVI